MVAFRVNMKLIKRRISNAVNALDKKGTLIPRA
jgi:hypothetical protein